MPYQVLILPDFFLSDEIKNQFKFCHLPLTPINLFFQHNEKGDIHRIINGFEKV
jgi:hypothetical protein